MRLITLLFLSTLIAYPAFAEDDPGFYVGASVGQASLDGTVRGDLVPFSIAVDDEDTLWGVTVGYDTGKWFSLELGYVDLGETSNTVNAFGAFGLFGVIDFAPPQPCKQPPRCAA